MGNAILESGLARELARARSGGMALYSVEHSYAGMQVMYDAVKRALPSGMTDRDSPYRSSWFHLDPEEDWLDRYYEWMKVGERRLFLCAGDRAIWIGHTYRPGEIGTRYYIDIDNKDYHISWYSPDNNPLGTTRMRRQPETGCNIMPSKPSRINMATWKKFDAAWREWCHCVLRRDDIRMDNREFIRLAVSENADCRIDAAMNATHENMYVCHQEGQLLMHDQDVRVRMALARNRWVGPNFMRQSSEDPDWHVRLNVCMGLASGMRPLNQTANIGMDDEQTAGVVKKLANDPEYEVRLAAAELLYNNRGDNSAELFNAVLDSPYDDDFKAVMAMARMKQ